MDWGRMNKLLERAACFRCRQSRSCGHGKSHIEALNEPATCIRLRPLWQIKHEHADAGRGAVRRERGIWHGPPKRLEWRRAFGQVPGD